MGTPVLVTGPPARRRPVEHDRGPSRAQLGQLRTVDPLRPETVEQHPDPDPGAGPLCQCVGYLVCDVTLAPEVGEQVDGRSARPICSSHAGKISSPLRSTSTELPSVNGTPSSASSSRRGSRQAAGVGSAARITGGILPHRLAVGRIVLLRAPAALARLPTLTAPLRPWTIAGPAPQRVRPAHSGGPVQ